MRTFPCAVPGRVTACAVALLALVLLVPAAPSAGAAAGDGDKTLKQQKHAIDRQQQGARQDLDASSRQVTRALERLTGSKAKLVTARSSLTTAQAALRTARAADRRAAAALTLAETRLTTARANLVAGKKAVAAQHVTVLDTITGYYEQGDPQLLALTSLMDSETPADVTRKISLMGTVVGTQTHTWDDLQVAEAKLAATRTAVRTARNTVAAKRRAAAAQLTTTRTAEQTARTARTSVRSAVTANTAAVESARKLKRADRAELARLARQEKRVQAKILAAARRAAAAKQSAYDGDTGGILLRPVDGPVTSPYGYRIHPIYGYWGLHDGTDFGAGCGTPLRAVAAGSVLSEYYSSVWGNRLYLNLGSYNGHNVTVIYNHLSSYRATTGQSVARGETVGYVGTTGWSTGCHLHFTVMVDGNPVDPMGWVS